MYMLHYETDLILLQRLVFLLIKAKHAFLTLRDVERDHMVSWDGQEFKRINIQAYMHACHAYECNISVHGQYI